MRMSLPLPDSADETYLECCIKYKSVSHRVHKGNCGCELVKFLGGGTVQDVD